LDTNEKITLKDLSDLVSEDSYNTFNTAYKWCDDVINNSQPIINELLKSHSINSTNLCFIAAGSVGRREALAASDLDFIPISRDVVTLNEYNKIDKSIRKAIEANTKIKVSAGNELTKPICLAELASPDYIGGEKDSREKLTQRILILAESAQIAGEFGLSEVKNIILNAYIAPERTLGRHPLSFCNDIARYYRTLCIDYKFKVDKPGMKELDWCTRNVKLRHSRKFWYFSTLVALASISKSARPDNPIFIKRIIEKLDSPPILRLVSSIPKYHRFAVGHTIDIYAWYLHYMADKTRRLKLRKIVFDNRHDHSKNNPYPALEKNSKLLHFALLGLLECLDMDVRNRIMEWFLL
jgi:hypothetical protein